MTKRIIIRGRRKKNEKREYLNIECCIKKFDPPKKKVGGKREKMKYLNREREQAC